MEGGHNFRLHRLHCRQDRHPRHHQHRNDQPFPAGFQRTSQRCRIARVYDRSPQRWLWPRHDKEPIQLAARRAVNVDCQGGPPWGTCEQMSIGCSSVLMLVLARARVGNDRGRTSAGVHPVPPSPRAPLASVFGISPGTLRHDPVGPDRGPLRTTTTRQYRDCIYRYARVRFSRMIPLAPSNPGPLPPA